MVNPANEKLGYGYVIIDSMLGKQSLRLRLYAYDYEALAGCILT